MCRKIRCDKKSCKFFEFWSDLNRPFIVYDKFFGVNDSFNIYLKFLK
jgi:hypothetical protein